MFDKLPAELLCAIARYLPSNTVGALAQTSRHCYNAILPMMYHDLSLSEPNALFELSSWLVDNPLCLQHAQQYVRNVNICHDSECVLPRYAVLNHVFWGRHLLNNKEAGSTVPNQRRRNIDVLVAVMLTRFPNISHITLEFDATTAGAICNRTGAVRCRPGASFTGAVKLLQYRPGNSRLLCALLAAFPACTCLVLRTRPYLSLCAIIEDSLLLENDFDALASVSLARIRQLELAYVDDNTVPLRSIHTLMQGLPNIEILALEWVLPPSLDYYDDLCQCLAEAASLYPEPVHRLTSTYRTIFYYHRTPLSLLKRMSALKI